MDKDLKVYHSLGHIFFKSTEVYSRYMYIVGHLKILSNFSSPSCVSRGVRISMGAKQYLLYTYFAIFFIHLLKLYTSPTKQVMVIFFKFILLDSHNLAHILHGPFFDQQNDDLDQGFLYT